jgi:hypothetical protein
MPAAARVLGTCGALLLAAGAAGCASVVLGDTQEVHFEVVDAAGTAVTGAACAFTSDRGSWPQKSPGLVVVPRSPTDLKVRCEADGHPPGEVRAVSRANAPLFLNLLLGATAAAGYGVVVGGAIDHWKGAGYDYPKAIRVVLGESRVADPLEEKR